MTRDHDQRQPSLTARIPADVDRPDEILWNLTARQVAIAATVAVGLWLGYTATRGLVPFTVFAAVAVPVAGAAAALILSRRDGLSLDQLVMAGLRWWRSPRRLIPTGTAGRVRGAPRWVAVPAGPLPAPLCLPPDSIATTGVVDLGKDGVAAVLACSTVNFALRTPAEQHGLASAWARWLNSLTGPVQVVVRADAINLRPLIDGIDEWAAGLPHLALEEAARGHAAFLADLAESRDLLRRHVLLVLREPVGPGSDGRQAAVARVQRRAAEAAAALAAAEITVRVLDGPQAAAALASAADPHLPPAPAGPHVAGPGQPVTSPDFADLTREANRCPR